MLHETWYSKNSILHPISVEWTWTTSCHLNYIKAGQGAHFIKTSGLHSNHSPFWFSLHSKLTSFNFHSIQMSKAGQWSKITPSSILGIADHYEGRVILHTLLTHCQHRVWDTLGSQGGTNTSYQIFSFQLQIDNMSFCLNIEMIFRGFSLRCVMNNLWRLKKIFLPRGRRGQGRNDWSCHWSIIYCAPDWYQEVCVFQYFQQNHLIFLHTLVTQG